MLKRLTFNNVDATKLRSIEEQQSTLLLWEDDDIKQRLQSICILNQLLIFHFIYSFEHFYGKIMTSNKDYSLFASSTASARGLCVGSQNFSMYLSKTCYPWIVIFVFLIFSVSDYFCLCLATSDCTGIRYDCSYWTKVLLRFIRKENLTDPLCEIF